MGCNTVPEVSRLEAKIIAQGIDGRVGDICFAWMTRPVSGVSMYERVRGRPYNQEERASLARERASVSRMVCPFLRSGVCFLGENRPYECKGQSPTGGEVGFLPALLAIELAREEVADLIDRGKVADAKVALEYKAPPSPESERTKEREQCLMKGGPDALDRLLL